MAEQQEKLRQIDHEYLFALALGFNRRRVRRVRADSGTGAGIVEPGADCGTGATVEPGVYGTGRPRNMASFGVMGTRISFMTCSFAVIVAARRARRQ